MTNFSPNSFPPPTGPPMLPPDQAPPSWASVSEPVAPEPVPFQPQPDTLAVDDVYDDDVATRSRARWGMGDIVLALPFVVATSIVATIVAVAATWQESQKFITAVADSDAAPALPAVVMVASLFGQQVGQGLWPVIVSRWKGSGIVKDFGFRLQPTDLVIGFGVAIATLVVAGIAGLVAGAAVGLSPEDEVSNTQILDDVMDSPWKWAIVAFIGIGAPLTEELLFRGLILRAIEKRLGTVAGVVGSSILFLLVHFQGGPADEVIVLFSVIGAVGLVMAIATVTLKRLGPAIVAHCLFNMTTVLAIFTTNS